MAKDNLSLFNVNRVEPKTRVNTINQIEEEYGKLFSYYDVENLFNKENYRGCSFSRFIAIMDEYYLIAYSSKLTRNSWLIFNWIRNLCRADGFVALSYKQAIDLFCLYGNSISKPTFFKCIAELVEQKLIYKINTNKLYNGRYTKDTNIYAIVDKTNDIFKLVDLLEMNDYNLSKSLTKDDIVVVDKNKKKSTAIPNDKKYKLNMLMFKGIKNELENFFEFLGSYNNSGRIAITRKISILESLKEYKERLSLVDIANGIDITISRTAKGNNPKKERYLFGVLNNMEPSKNVKANSYKNKADIKLSNSNSNSYGTKGISLTEAKELSKLLTTNQGYYKAIIKRFNGKVENSLEEKLLKTAIVIEKKFDTYLKKSDLSLERIKACESIGYYEWEYYDNKWNKYICYYDAKENPVDFETVIAKAKDNNIDLKYYKFEHLTNKHEE